VYQPASKEQQKQRRRQLRQQRRIKVLKSIWRFACMSGILTGLVWVVSQPDWRISKPAQVQIQGNQYLSDTTIRDWLAIPYPKLIMELAPAQLTAKLIGRSSISSVKIDRALLPPHLVVQVEDLPPVARIVLNESTESQTFVDELGRQLPLSSYRSTVWRSLPKLGLRPPTPGPCPKWPQIYHAVLTSPVAIGIVDCHNPQNLILQTELGKIRLGAIRDQSHLNKQMQQLDRIRDWRKHVDPTDVDYLDLENPDALKFQLKQSGTMPPKLLKSPSI
jgi:cell division protein FtsQ